MQNVSAIMLLAVMLDARVSLVMLLRPSKSDTRLTHIYIGTVPDSSRSDAIDQGASGCPLC